jgi:hypothetical protein
MSAGLDPALCLCGYFRKRDTQGVGHPSAVCRVSFQAIADVANLDLPRRILDGAGGVGKEERLFLGADQAEEEAGLGVVVVIVIAEVPVVRGPLQGQGRLSEFRLLLPFTVAVGLIAEGAAIIAVNPHGAVAVVAVVRATRRVDRDLVVVHAEPVALGVSVGKESPLEHLVGGESDAGHHVGRVEGRLFDFGEIVLRGAVQFENPQFDQRIILFQHLKIEIGQEKKCSLAQWPVCFLAPSSISIPPQRFSRFSWAES